MSVVFSMAIGTGYEDPTQDGGTGDVLKTRNLSSLHRLFLDKCMVCEANFD